MHPVISGERESMSEREDKPNLRIKGRLMSASEVERTLVRLAHEIVEKSNGSEDLALVGIKRRGVPLAERLGKLISGIEKRTVDTGVLDIQFYRDDLSTAGIRPVVTPGAIGFDIEGRDVVLCDDVLYTGRTIRAALDALFDHGRPRRVQLAVLIDRGHRELPIEATYVGKYVPTSSREIIEVKFREVDNDEQVLLVERMDRKAARSCESMNSAATPTRRQLHPPPALASPFPYHPGSLLSASDLSLDGVSHILNRATILENADPLVRDRILAKRRLALLFYESSTRTRTSFELAAKGLGADTTLVSSLSSSIEKGESLKDTGLTLRALGAEAIILRHNSSGAAWLLEAETRLPVLNAGDGMHEHPTQALLDLRTILAHLRPGVEAVDAETLAGVTITIVGDIQHSRVARSNMLLLPRMGARVLLCGPKELLPELAAQVGPGISIERDFDAALRQSQAVMMLRIQAERLAGLQLDLEQYKANYQLTGPRLAAHAPTALVMHPGPIIRGLEVTSGVADGVQSVILEQVKNGVAIRMAVVERALTASPDGGRA